MATYAKLLALIGVSVGLTELQHALLLALAIITSLLVSAWRSVVARRAWPVLFALTGSGFVLLGHLDGELHVVEWLGVLVLLGSSVAEQLRIPRARVMSGG